MINVVTYGHLVLSHIFYYAVIHHFLAIVKKTVDGIVVRIAGNVRNYFLNQFKRVCIRQTLKMIQREPTFLCSVLFFDTYSKFTGRFSFPESEWNDVSEEAKDLIRRLLVKEAPKRISAAAVLYHPWIKWAGEEDTNNYSSVISVKMEKRRRALKTPGIIRQ